MKSAEDFLAELNIKSGADLGSDFHSSTHRNPKMEPDFMSGFSDIESLKKQIENRAVSLLATREHGAKELKQKLLQRFPETAELLRAHNEVPGLMMSLVEEVIEHCQENNWQSDERYVEQAIRSYVAKGHGPLKIQQKLQQACANSALIRAYLDWDESEWVELAQQALEKKYGNSQKPAEQKEQARRMRFLQSRGFLPSTVWKSFR